MKTGAYTLQSLLDDALDGSPRTRMHKAVIILPLDEHASCHAIVADVKSREENRKKWPHSPKRAHIGIGGFFNVEIMGLTRPEFAILLDKNDNQRLLWNATIALLKTCKSAAEFRTELRKKIREEQFDLSEPTDTLIGGLNNATKHPFEYGDGLGWTRDEAIYQHIRKMAMEGKILIASMDLIRDNEAVSKLKEWMDKQEIAAETIYLSNLYGVIRPKDISGKHGFKGGAEEAADYISEEKAFSPSPFQSQPEMHHDVLALMKNVQKLMQGDQPAVCFLASTNGALAALDSDWAKTYEASQWRWTIEEERKRLADNDAGKKR